MSFIDTHRGRFGGVEPICRVLTQHGVRIAANSYYAARNRPSSARAVRDEQLPPGSAKSTRAALGWWWRCTERLGALFPRSGAAPR